MVHTRAPQMRTSWVPCSRPGAWGVCRLLSVILLQTVFSMGYEIIAPRTYTAFSGGIPVTYSIPEGVRLSNGTVQLVSLHAGRVIAEVPLPAGYNNGELTFLCGLVDRAGSYVIRMLDNSKKPALAESQTMVVSWPRTSLVLPADHQTLSGEVPLSISVSGALCDSPHSNISYTLEVAFFGVHETTSHHNTKSVQIVHSEKITKIANLRTTISFRCTLFDQGGTYQVMFKSVYDNENPLAVSNKMATTWNPAYSLSTVSSSIFPCRKVLVVQYTQAQCTGNNDKIRLYKQVHKADSSIASPIDLVYLTERRARLAQDAVTFRCDLFHESVAGYCFKYISTAGNGAVHEQVTMCIRTNDIEAPVIDGGWSQWSEWSACTTSCGGGQQNRVRTCDSPAPSIGGQYCKGDTTEWQDCGAPCRETTTRLPLNFYTPDPRCECGCELLEAQGTIVSSRRCLGSNLWIVRTVKGHVIQLNFIHFTLDPANSQTWVKVRNGDSHMSDLLIHSPGEGLPGPIRTTQNAMLIEFMAPFDQTPIYKSSYEGFVADYITMADNSSALVAPADDNRSQAIWESTIAVVGITLCGVIILATVAFVCHHRVAAKRKKEKRAHVHEALLTSAGVANSPSHSGSVIGSPNVSYSDPLGSPTKSPTKRNYILAKGVTAQPQTPTSMSAGSYASDRNRARKYPPPGGVIPGGREVSRAPHKGMSSQSSLSQAASQHTSPLPSPYAINSEAKDFYHDPKMFKTSSLPDEPPGQGGRTKGGHRSHNRPRHPRDHGRDHGPSSPGSMSPASSAATSPTRADQRPPGHRPKPPPGAPLAGEEDLSPTSPTKLQPRQSPAHRYRENIQLDSIREPGKQKTRRQQDTSLTEPSGRRPPVEGRDSLHRGKGTPSSREGDRKTGKPSTPSKGTPGLNTPDRQNANYIPGTGRPTVKPLPLRDVQRPDGQSPESRSEDPNANTPSSYRSSDLSPVLRPSKLFPDSQSVDTPSAEFVTNEDFEYDDYVPTLPGSYFTMDPDAYQLTWSNQQPWSKYQQSSRSASQASMDTDRQSRRNNTSNC